MDWTLAVTAVVTLIAAGGGAVLGATTSSRRNEDTVVRSQQIETLVEVLKQADLHATRIHEIYRGRSQTQVTWDDWRAAVRRASIFLEADLVDAILDVDRQLAVQHRGTMFMRGALSSLDLREIEEPFETSRDFLVTIARQVFGHQDLPSASTGVPDVDDEIWQEQYWVRRLGL